MHSPAEQITQLEAAIAAQEALRPSLGDSIVDVTVAALHARLQALKSPSRPTTPVTPTSANSHAALPPEQMMAQLQSYLPRELAGKMRAMGRIEGERKQVTVLFADISEFTALSERLDPEMVAALSNDVLKQLAETVYRYEGYIDKFVGDAVMAVFGAPVAHEDDPERALCAALAMRESMEDFNRRWVERLGRPLTLHIGINTGIVIAGNVGSDLRLSYSVMGDTVNTASRLQDAAQPGQILVSRSTYRLTREAFTFVTLEPITVKGKQEPLAVYELQRAKVLPGKVRGVRELAPAFVGRERELARLHEITDDLANGHGCIVAIPGEAGIGKSRLVAEWREEVGGHVLWLEGRAFAHTSSLSYAPFLDLLRRSTGISDEDGEPQVRARLRNTIERFFPGNNEAYHLFAHMLALSPTPEDKSVLDQISAQGLRERLVRLLEELLTSLARQRPTVVLIEDVQWADSTSLELIEHLATLVGRVPLTVVCTLRPNISESLTNLFELLKGRYGERFKVVELTSLPEQASVEMAAQLLSMHELPPQLRTLIVRKADGNPFFVEELIRSLIERGALTRADAGGRWIVTTLIETVTAPDTLQALLMARLDRLPAEAKWLAQQAAVIGRVFLRRVLLQMAEGDAHVEDSLNCLEREGLIHVITYQPEVEYIFQHTLTQEVAYGSLLAPRRKELHCRVATAIESLFPDRLPEFQSIIGEHFLRCEDWAKAAHYLAQAGDAAARLYAHPEARLHYAGALKALSVLPATLENRRARVDLVVKHVAVSWSSEPLDRNFARLLEVKALLKSLPGPDGRPGGDRRRWASVHYWMGRIQYLRNLPQEAVAYYQQVLAVAQELNDPELIAMPASFIGQALAVQGHFTRAEELLKQAITPLEKAGNWPEWIRANGYYSDCLAALGDIAAGRERAERTVRVARERNFTLGIAMSQIYLTAACLFGGDLNCMLNASHQAMEVAQQTGDRLITYLAYGFHGWAEGRSGNFKAAQEDFARSKVIGQGVGASVMLSDWFLAAEAEVAFAEGRYEEACEQARNTVNRTEPSGSMFATAIARRAWGQALAALYPQRWEEAEAHLTASLRALEECNCPPEMARTHLAWGLTCQRRSDIAEAQEHFASAAELFEQCGLQTELQQVNALAATQPATQPAEWIPNA